MPGMPLGGLGNSCRRPFVRRCSVVCLCVSEFPVDLREWPQRVRQLVAFGFFPAVHAGMILFEYMQS